MHYLCNLCVLSPHNWTSAFASSSHSLIALVHWKGCCQLLMHVFDAPEVGPASWQSLTPQPAPSLEPITGCVPPSCHCFAVTSFASPCPSRIIHGLSFRASCKSIAMQGIWKSENLRGSATRPFPDHSISSSPPTSFQVGMQPCCMRSMLDNEAPRRLIYPAPQGSHLPTGLLGFL